MLRSKQVKLKNNSLLAARPMKPKVTRQQAIQLMPTEIHTFSAMQVKPIMQLKLIKDSTPVPHGISGNKRYSWCQLLAQQQ
jgi:hypothetical protein